LAGQSEEKTIRACRFARPIDRREPASQLKQQFARAVFDSFLHNFCNEHDQYQTHPCPSYLGNATTLQVACLTEKLDAAAVEREGIMIG